MKQFLLSLALVLALGAPAFAQQAPNAASTDTVQTLTNKKLTDSSVRICDDGDLTKCILFQLSGVTTATDRTITVPDANVALGGGVSSVVKFNGFTITLDGSNPSSAAHGLTTAVACTASLQKTSTPGDDPTMWSLNINSANLDLYAYKTDGTDPTLVASTNNSAVFYVVCVGT